MELAAFRQRAAAHQLKAEMQGAGLDAGKCSDLQPDAGDALRVVLHCLLFDKFQSPLAEGDFVHDASSMNCAIECNNGASLIFVKA
jgi:hypothetical protein